MAAGPGGKTDYPAIADKTPAPMTKPKTDLPGMIAATDRAIAVGKPAKTTLGQKVRNTITMGREAIASALKPRVTAPSPKAKPAAPAVNFSAAPPITKGGAQNIGESKPTRPTMEAMGPVEEKGHPDKNNKQPSRSAIYQPKSANEPWRQAPDASLESPVDRNKSDMDNYANLRKKGYTSKQAATMIGLKDQKVPSWMEDTLLGKAINRLNKY